MIDVLTVTAVAQVLGIEPVTWRAYVSRGRAPQPDGHLDARTPFWYRDTIVKWEAAREAARPSS